MSKVVTDSKCTYNTCNVEAETRGCYEMIYKPI